ncbi:low molecular weight phosphatase family protein [Kistimonas asteriae]|uniref:arsenate-mycothiol transferase ArsC n=1 Tax=Kistimonas asteriae TaxID=517724 RepID=UPI001BAE03FC|nr:low molecular weight phosphatase family protein [Kistimonas asteriae]
MKKVLFLCTGNYYRSRFSEEYFNHYAQLAALPYEAASRALLQDLSVTGNVGNMAEVAVSTLQALGIPVKGLKRHPQSLIEQDIVDADIIIAMDKTEHQPMLEQRFPSYSQTVHYYAVKDVDQVPASEALKALSQMLDELLSELAKNK